MQSDNLIRISAAGAGKTYTICHEAIETAQSKNSIIITYTNRGIESIRNELRKANSGVMPICVETLSWYAFILREMIKPYQSIIYDINQLQGLNFQLMHERNYNKKTDPSRYIDSIGNVRAEEASSLAIVLNERSGGAVMSRIERIYSHIYIDEVQDMAGYDLDVIKLLMDSNVPVTIVGDGKQATFQTHYSRRNKNKSGEKFWEFFDHAKNDGLCRIEKNLCSRRFNKQICNFANKIYPNENNISTCMTETTGHDGVFLILEQDVERYCSTFHPTILRYNNRTDTRGYDSYNFGECKGMTFDRILIFPNKQLSEFIMKGSKLNSPMKYYVAVTRAKYSVAIVINGNGNFESGEKIKIDDGNMTVYRIC
ncbi:UvrD/REP helicase N-terminal domain-containing protein [Eubacterium pyruvativorans]|uniref:UvrD/REP helicase N-terminal domain-containing protein n=1 Tax=Eubacterium pyruvativorans TaxID=155865 RepID=A0A1I7I1N8_9FIRM|nr:UvrD-helicase domain-containing protein [Eubacterium pyruvativorans]SFO36320.1 UvrD/REP helicase N-terminal domain-containing protein [Eubacterium pyruvativorans]SFU66870.1 UvrD/REP helicase N-terminal domain-containing protein [Eubacterium pyruvativorans]